MMKFNYWQNENVEYNLLAESLSLNRVFYFHSYKSYIQQSNLTSLKVQISYQGCRKEKLNSCSSKDCVENK